MTQVDHDLTTVNRFDQCLWLIKKLGRHNGIAVSTAGEKQVLNGIVVSTAGELQVLDGIVVAPRSLSLSRPSPMQWKDKKSLVVSQSPPPRVTGSTCGCKLERKEKSHAPRDEDPMAVEKVIEKKLNSKHLMPSKSIFFLKIKD
jgi:hypothetical protein